MNLLMLLLVTLAAFGAGVVMLWTAATPEPKRVRVEDSRPGRHRLR